MKMKDNRYKIYIEDETIITYDNVILDNDLLYKKEIDNNLYKKIVSATNYYDVYNKVIKYILKKRRSIKETKQYLIKFNLSDNDSNKILNKLKDINLLNDIEYCKSYINDKVYLSKTGINKIRMDLLNEDISIDVIENELNNIDKSILNNRLEKLIIKKIQNNKKYSNYHLKQKILNEMINLGYSKDLILKIIDNNLKNEDEITSIEFNKLYNKLKIKYSGIDLDNRLRQKMVSKGFKIDKINKLVQEKTKE